MAVADLHVHSAFSDGDWQPERVIQGARAVGAFAISLTDHNGVWGLQAGRQAAATAGIEFVDGIEVSSLLDGVAVHILGFARRFVAETLAAGLEETCTGYHARVAQMAQRCQQAGYDQVTMEEIERRRAGQDSPCYVTYDVARLLTDFYGMGIEEARRLTVTNGTFFVPYGSWAMTPDAAVALVHAAGGVAVLAHPGIVAAEAGDAFLERLLTTLAAAGLDGIEAYHPFHTAEFAAQAQQWASAKDWLITGGSDWHGEERFARSQVGKIGISRERYHALVERLPGA